MGKGVTRVFNIGDRRSRDPGGWTNPRVPHYFLFFFLGGGGGTPLPPPLRGPPKHPRDLMGL